MPLSTHIIVTPEICCEYCTPALIVLTSSWMSPNIRSSVPSLRPECELLLTEIYHTIFFCWTTEKTLDCT